MYLPYRFERILLLLLSQINSQLLNFDVGGSAVPLWTALNCIMRCIKAPHSACSSNLTK